MMPQGCAMVVDTITCSWRGVAWRGSVLFPQSENSGHLHFNSVSIVSWTTDLECRKWCVGIS